jgi:hypothetical protein
MSPVSPSLRSTTARNWIISIAVMAVVLSAASAGESIAAQRTTKIACWDGSGFVGRERPRACNIVKYGTGGPGAHNTYVIRKIRWRRFGGRVAVGRGVFYPSHANKKRIRLKLFRRSRNCRPGLATYSKVRMYTRGSIINSFMYVPPGCYFD